MTKKNEAKTVQRTGRGKTAASQRKRAAKPENGSVGFLKARQTQAKNSEKEQLLSSEVVYEGKLFRVLHDKLIEPGGKHSERDVIRHHGSVVMMAIDSTRGRQDPWIVVERQYRHAALRHLWELPAGKLNAGEDPLEGAKRELEEETGYRAKKWRPLVEYYGSPGFLGESMKVFVAEGLIAGDAHPEEDEHIEFRLVKLSELLKMIEAGEIIDGKTLTSVLLFARLQKRKHKKSR